LILFAPDYLLNKFKLEFDLVINTDNEVDRKYSLKYTMKKKIHSFLNIKFENNIEYSNFSELETLIKEIFNLYKIDKEDYFMFALRGQITTEDVNLRDLHLLLDPLILQDVLEQVQTSEKDLIKQLLEEIIKEMENYIKYYNDHLTLEMIGLKDIYLINLPNRTDRFQHMKKELYALKFNFTVFPAFHGNSLNLLLSKNKTITNLSPESKLNYTIIKDQLKDADWGQVGCWQSHLHVFFQIRDKIKAEGNDGPVLILEDDVSFYDEFKVILKTALAKLPPDWEILGPGHCSFNCLNQTNLSENICKTDVWYCTHGYIVRNLITVEKLITYFNTEHFEVADHITHKLANNSLMNIYVTNPEMIMQQISIYGTDIQIENS